jgi:DNA polymerase III subunit epsilon
MFKRRNAFNKGGFPTCGGVQPRRSFPGKRLLHTLDLNQPFVAIDFETADEEPDSACAVAVVRVEGDAIVERRHALIQPPRQYFQFTHLHGISWERVKAEPIFATAWPRLESILDGAAFLAAHNSSFDSSVLEACCAAAGLTLPTLPFLCTVELARRIWRIYPTKLPNVCAKLGLPLKHHDPCSDAEACAKIVLAARKHKSKG